VPLQDQCHRLINLYRIRCSLRKMLFQLAAILAFVAVGRSQNVWGVTPTNELVYFGGDLGLTFGFWTLIGKPFAPPPPLYTPLIQVGDVDSQNGVFYGIAANSTSGTFAVEVFGVDTSSGQIVATVKIPFLLNRNFVNTPGLDWIRGTGDVLVYGPLGGGQFQILRVTPKTNTVLPIATWMSNELTQSVDAYDPVNSVLWVQTTFNNVDSLLGFNIESGTQVQNVTDPYSIQTLNYDNVNKKLYALAAPANGATAIISLDTLTGSLKTIGSVPHSLTIAGPSNAALNSVERILYVFGGDENDVTHFVGINIDTLAYGEVPFHPAYSTIPTTIAWAFSTTK